MLSEIRKLFLIKRMSYKSLRTLKTYRNHYEILNLKQDCNVKEIREAFLKLSKQYHPDKNKSSNTHADFVKLSEAYSVLSKPVSRESYDLSLSIKPFDSSQYRTANWNVHQHSQDGQDFYYNKNSFEEKFRRSKPYYGIKGLKKVSNFKIVLLCICIAGVGVAVQLFLIMKSFTLRREKLLEQSYENSQILMNIRNNAKENGNEKQLQLLQSKLEHIEKHAKRS